MKVTITEEQCGIQCKASHFESESDSFLLTQLITDDVMIMIVNNVDSAKLEYLNSVVTTVTYVYETIDTRCDTVWTNKLSLIQTTPSK